MSNQTEHDTNHCVYVDLRYIAIIPSVYHGWYQASKHQKSIMFTTSLFLCLCGGFAHNAYNRHFTFPKSANLPVPSVKNFDFHIKHKKVWSMCEKTPPGSQQMEVRLGTAVVQAAVKQRLERKGIVQAVDVRVGAQHQLVGIQFAHYSRWSARARRPAKVPIRCFSIPSFRLRLGVFPF